MKFFIDTANVEEIREAVSYGLLDGVTTNPTLLSKESGEPRAILQEITKLVEGPVSAEVTALDAAGMIAEGLELRKIADNIVVKVPMTLEGMKAIRTFSEQGIPTNCTLDLQRGAGADGREGGRRVRCRRSSAGSTTSRPTAWS